ncbi:hypothetical protein EDB92DRAFT_1794344 [Lactarius akahatsu]|uniref:Uncharacterized protein n=1 Tax=Lactarius akahatsu TaxID=416441 RepID=A0AAD4QFG0_9AGAM|nr:hypothetical protein EDB92DRAFT_1794344 [Lactarius akahatsu]
MRCFAHTINISAKAVLRQFDIPKKRDGEELDEVGRALADLAEGLDLEEHMEQETQEMANGNEDDKPLEAWDDFHGGLTREEVRQLDVSVQPMRSMLVKLRKLAFALKNSTTKLLPAWYNTLTSLRLPHRMMPRDVTTHWNSTFDMLVFVIQYRLAIDLMTATRNLGLRKHELVSTEWVVTTEL